MKGKSARVVPVIAALVAVAITVGYAGYRSLSSTPPAAPSIEVTETAPPELNDPKIDDIADTWLKLIREAKYTIDIEAYYLNPPQGPLGDVYSALKDAADRGVEIRILVDGRNYARDIVKELDQHEGITALPFPRQTHAKYMIVDGKVVSVGSTNWSYYALTFNREVNLTLYGEEMAGTYTYIFESGWVAAGGEPRGSEYWGADWVIPVANGPEVPVEVTRTLDAFAALIDRAEKNVYIYMYIYNGMPPKLREALVSALDRGVRVEVMVDKESLKWEYALKELAGREGVGVTVIRHPYSAHPKVIVVDNEWAYVGSANIDIRYITDGGRDVGVMVRSPEVVGDLMKIFQRDWGSVYSSWLE
ncbi:MAG: phosphatidylserine/phosphatidylglycerophosphate/cardiolipin synthase family protein [Candidatus Hodarchaeaceae archaeon]|nr:phosphatidylserine/phosphatidylglycerophosphate/cardiolipin synthase family protein [Candidatus Hodarchaeaceae archaeon]